VIYALTGGEREREKSYGFSPCLLGQKVWLEDETRGYRGVGAIGETKLGGDTGY
jgi:hypothetical protein